MYWVSGMAKKVEFTSSVALLSRKIHAQLLEPPYLVLGESLRKLLTSDPTHLLQSYSLYLSTSMSEVRKGGRIDNALHWTMQRYSNCGGTTLSRV